MKCFQYNKKLKKSCAKKDCRYWISHSKSNNCVIVASEKEGFNNEKFTLQDIGDMFKVTRMRICQIEKIAISKLKDKFSNMQ